MTSDRSTRLDWVVPALVALLAIGGFFLYLRSGVTGFASSATALASALFIIAGYVALRRTFGQPAIVCLAVMAGIAVHPVFVRAGSDELAQALARILGLGAALAIVWAERRNRPGDWIAVAVPLAAAILASAQTLSLLVATVAGLLIHGRKREAAVVGAGTAILLVPGVLWVATHGAAIFGGLPIIHGADLVPTLIRAYAVALPIWLLPGVFMRVTTSMGTPSWTMVLVGFTTSAVILGGLRRAWKAANLAGRILCLHAGFVAVLFAVWAASSQAGIGAVALLLTSVAPILLIGLWMWKATEESAERVVWERIRPYVAVLWIAGALISAPFLLR